MFPLETPVARVSDVSMNTAAADNLSTVIPSVGAHTKDYTIYRSSNRPSPVLHRLIQRASVVSGIEETTLRYSVRWIESKLSRGQSVHQLL
jgi:hypothetical protein